MRSEMIRIALFGSSGVGKSAIAVRLITRRFIGDYTSEQDMYYKHNLAVNEDTLVKIEILDTSMGAVNKVDASSSPLPADQVEDKAAWCNAAAIVYSIDDRASFERARELLRCVKKDRPRLPCLLLANKSDLGHVRAVHDTEGFELALGYPACRFGEVSAADDWAPIQRHFAALAQDSIAYLAVSRRSPPRRRKSIAYMARAIMFAMKSNVRPGPPSPP